MIRRALLTLALLAAPAIVVAQQPSPMTGQAPADSSKAKMKMTAKHSTKKGTTRKHGTKPTAKPAAKPDTGAAKP
jgi:hypothetical protein